MKKILIVYATAGIGHKKASFAVSQALGEIAPKDAEVTVIDSLDYTNAFFKWFYLESYLLMVNKLPLVWGVLYYLTDNRFVNIIVSKLRRINNWLNSARLREYLTRTKPDVIICTHFFASEVIGDMKARGFLDSRLITVVTDYRLHSWWVEGVTDMYVVGSEEARSDLVRWGADPSKIKVLGIPVEPVFAKPLDREALRARAGLKRDIPTILVLGGGFGVGPILDIVRIIDAMPVAAQIIAICGHNDNLVRQLEAMKPSLSRDLHVFGFVQNVYEHMEVADVLISKSGGITVSESLARQLPMIVISPIIGQETRNCDFLTANGAAVKAATLSDLRVILEGLAGRPEKLKEMRDAIGRIRKPTACYDIAKLALWL